jgi:hypothetical protein
MVMTHPFGNRIANVDLPGIFSKCSKEKIAAFSHASLFEVRSQSFTVFIFYPRQTLATHTTWYQSLKPIP